MTLDSVPELARRVLHLEMELKRNKPSHGTDNAALLKRISALESSVAMISKATPAKPQVYTPKPAVTVPKPADKSLATKMATLEREVERLRVKERPVGGGGGVTDHGLLTGLEDNDHPQYLLTTGKAADSTKLEATTPTTVGLSLVGATNAAAARTAIGMKFTPISGMADDTATSITPSNSQGFILIRALGRSTGACIAFDAVSGTAYCMMIAGSADIAVTTGALTGKSGVDGKLTVSAATNGLIYLNNRLGATVYLGYYCL